MWAHLRAAGLIVLCAWPVAAGAQDYPAKPIRLVVPFPPGGPNDVIGRVVGQKMQDLLGQLVIIDNRAGAGGIVGTQAVANAAPDGYSFCVCSIGAVSIAPFIQKVGYDPVSDLAPIGIVSSIPQMVIANNKLPVRRMPELVAYAKAHPGKLNYGSSGAGGLTHYSVELFLARIATTAVHIPFKGGAPATAAVVSGDVDFAFGNMTDALPQVEGGGVRGLAVTSLKRSAYFPDLPTVDESVLPGFIAETWNGVMAPPKTPEPIIRRMSEVLIRMADDPEFKESMRKAGAGTAKSTPAEFRAQIAQEIAQWKPLIAEIAEKK
jgi:tripartite-type tricarboxylate transporter receptor subunit TctC